MVSNGQKCSQHPEDVDVVVAEEFAVHSMPLLLMKEFAILPSNRDNKARVFVLV